MEIAQLAIYRSPLTKKDLKITVKDVAAGRDALKAARSATHPVESFAPKRVLIPFGTDRSQEKLDRKVNVSKNYLE